MPKLLSLTDTIQHTCRSTYPAFNHGGERTQASIRYVVLHSTEGDTAKGAAEYFTHPQSGGSANLVVDDTVCYRCLGDNVIPWGAPPLNTHGFHIEQAGYAKWSRTEWMAHEQTIERAAFKAALRCKWYRIPARLLDVAALKKDYGDAETKGLAPGGGITTHAVISAAFGLTNHTDPGDSYPLDVFLDHLDRHLASDL